MIWFIIHLQGRNSWWRTVTV